MYISSKTSTQPGGEFRLEVADLRGMTATFSNNLVWLLVENAP